MREENDGVNALIAGKDAPFVLDTTMAVVRRRDGEGRALLTLVSPVKCDEATLDHIKVGSYLMITPQILISMIQTGVCCDHSDRNTNLDLDDPNRSVAKSPT